MIIKDIQDIITGQTRTDGRYPQRIGCTVHFSMPICLDQSTILVYDKDNQGQAKDGYLITSKVRQFYESAHEIILITINSKYILQKEAPSEHFLSFWTE